MLSSSTVVTQHLSTLPEDRNQESGKYLMKHIIKWGNIEKIKAEADGDAVGFYQKLHFTCHEFKEKSNTRYECIWKCSSFASSQDFRSRALDN